VANLIIGAVFAVVTAYTDQGVTYCGKQTQELGPTWLAVPVEQIGTLYQCGDLVYIRGQDWSLLARVEDAGPFGNNFVIQEDGTYAPILFDIGGLTPFEGLSSPIVDWMNVSAEARRYGE